MSVARIHALVHADLVEPTRGPRGAFRFDFADVILLRTLNELKAAGVSAPRLRRSIASLREQLPEGAALSSVSIASDGNSVVVRDSGNAWNPESGQLQIDFSVRDLADQVAPITERIATSASESDLSDEEWFEIAVDLEAVKPEKSVDAYRRALRANPGHVGALLNLGRILHEEGRLEEAEALYARALAADPLSAKAAFNLGVAREDLGRTAAAIEAYRRALDTSPDFAAAHFNLGRLYEKSGKKTEALRHLSEYRRLEKVEESPRRG